MERGEAVQGSYSTPTTTNRKVNSKGDEDWQKIRCFSLGRSGKFHSVEEAGGNRGKEYELGTSRK